MMEEDLSWNDGLPPQWLLEEACQDPVPKNEGTWTSDTSGGERQNVTKVKSFMNFMVPGSLPVPTASKPPKKPRSGLQDIQSEVCKVYRKVDELKEDLQHTIHNSNGLEVELNDSYTVIESLKSELRSARGYIESQETTIENLVTEIGDLKNKLFCSPSLDSCCCGSMSSGTSKGSEKPHLRGGGHNNSLYRILKSISEDFSDNNRCVNSESDADPDETLPTIEELRSNGVDINRLVRILKTIVSGGPVAQKVVPEKKAMTRRNKPPVPTSKPDSKLPRQQTLAKEVDSLMQVKNQMRAEITILQERLRASEAKQKESIRKVASSNDTIRNLKLKIDSLESSLKQNKSDVSADKFSCNHLGEIKHLQYRIKSISGRILELTTENKDLKAKCDELQKKLEATREKKVKNEQQSTERQLLLETYRNKIVNLQNEMEEVKGEKQALDLRLKTLHKSHSKVKSQVDVSKQEMESKLKEFTEMEQQISSLNQELASLRTQKMRLKDLEKEISEKNEQIKAMEINNKIALQEHTEQSSVCMEDLKEKLARAEAWINEYLKFGNLIILDFQRLSVWKRKCDNNDHGEVRSSDHSMKAAQSLACNILNISNRQMENIMSSIPIPETPLQGWADISTLLKSVHEITTKAPFAQKLSTFIVDVVKRRLLT